MDGRRLGVLALATVSLVAAGLLSLQSDPSLVTGPPIQRRSATAKIIYPRDQPRRPRLMDRAAEVKAPAPTAPLPGEWDAFERATVVPGGGVVIAEVNAILNSPLASRILRCRDRDAARMMDVFRDRLGVDLATHVDRVSMSDGLSAATGFFADLTLPEEVGERQPYGDTGAVYTLESPDPAEQDLVFGRAGDDALFVGAAEAVRAAIDRYEGRGAMSERAAPSGGRGEIYGAIGPKLLERFAEDLGRPDLAAQVASGMLRMTVEDDVAMSIDLHGAGGSQDQLREAIEGAIAAGRSAAVMQKDRRLLGLLDKARIHVDDDGQLAIDLAFPADMVLEVFGCGPDAG